jgi:hypothetical protein
MNHLSDEQLSALLDDALTPGERAACDAHLAGCDACRARLAEASALDESLGKALTHDPGERYFAEFADRVAKRIAAGAAPGAAAPVPRRLDAAPEAPKARMSLWSWLTSPRGLALAGSTAALLVTAGIAWMRFHGEQDVSRALRQATSPVEPRARKEASPTANDEVSPAPAAQAPAAPSSDERARTDAAAPPRALARMQEVRTLPNGEQAPVPRPNEQGARQNALAAPATGSALAQMKRRSIAPAAEGGAPAAAGTVRPESAPREEAQASKDGETAAPSQRLAAPPAPAAAPPAAAKFAEEPRAAHQNALVMDTSRGQSFSAWGASKSLYKTGGANEIKADAKKLSGVAATCGKVRDSRGRVVAGAEITAVRNGVRTARTDAEGAFCVDGLGVGDTLTVMHVGFDPYTLVVTPMTSLAITLEPVGTLGPNSTMLTGKPQASPSFTGALHAHANASADSAPPAPSDPYAGQSSGIRQLARDARAATAIAQREQTAPAFERAAKDWSTVLRQVKGAPADDARFQHVSTLRSAYQLEPTAEREGRLRKAITAYLALTPETRPERATVARWQAELDSGPGR